jgi:ribosome-binding factor A
MPNRDERIPVIIKKNLTEIIAFKIKDPHLGFVTVSEVKVSKDFSYAKIYVSFLIKKDIKPGMQVLNKAKGFIRSELSKTLDTRRCPEIIFVLDDGFDKEQKIVDALKEKEELI